MDVDPREHPMSIQIFGGTEETLLQAAQYVDQHTDADIIDINMGCPVPKVTKTDAGSKWLLDSNKIYQMVHAVVQNVQKPVSVKMRIGWDRKHIFAVENALAAQEAGASMIAMHGRTRKQMYQGEADWGVLHDVAQVLDVPFVANGDIRTPELAKKALDEIGCTAVMVGRAALGNPWILQDMVHYLETGETLPPQTVREKVETAKHQLEGLIKIHGEKRAVPEFRQQAAYYLKGIPRSARIALLYYADGEKRYIIAPNGLQVGATLMSGAEAAPEIGNCLPLANIPVGTVIHNIELRPGQGALLVRSAGHFAQLTSLVTSVPP